MPKPGDRITKRKDGRYMARYTVHTPDGPKRKTIYGKKFKEAEAALAKARGGAARGLTFDAGNLTVGGWLDRYTAIFAYPVLVVREIKASPMQKKP